MALAFRCLGTAALATITLALSLGSGGEVQAAAVCNNTPTSGDRIECTESSTSTDDIDIDITGVAISTSGDNEPGIKASHEGTGNIEIDVTGTSGTTTIATTGAQSDGIAANHEGSGDIDINLHSHTKITTSGSGQNDTHGVDVYHQGTADDDITIDMTSGTIATSGPASRAIRARRDTGSTTDSAAGDVSITLTNSTVSTTSTTAASDAIEAWNKVAGEGNVSVTLENTVVSAARGAGLDASRENGSGDLTLNIDGGSITAANGGTAIYGTHTGTGKVDIDVRNAMVKSTSGSGDGVFSRHSGTGDIEIDVDQGSNVTTQDDEAVGITTVSSATGSVSVGLNGGSTIITHGNSADGISAARTGTPTGGSTTIRLSGGSRITTKGRVSFGIDAGHRGPDDLVIDLANAHILTESTAIGGTFNDTFSVGVYGRHDGAGNLDIDVRRGSVTTAGTYSYGLYGDHRGAGDIRIDTHSGFATTTTGPGGHGIVAYHSGTAATRSIDIMVGGPVTARGANTYGVLVGGVDSNGAPERVAALDNEGYRRQTVTVNNRISSQGPGIYLANGGRVIIGPRGSIDSQTSRIAIWATGTVPEDNSDPNNVIAAIPPKLRVDLNLGGRRVVQALGDGWIIINDGGETTIVMNNVVLHDGTMGATGNIATNGAWNVRMRADGLKIVSGGLSDRSEDVIVDRDFSGADFTEVRRPTPPPPEPEPEAMQVNEEIMADEGEEAAVHIEGDGAVHIGPQGSLRAASGIAILATRAAPDDEPELTVDLDLDGRTVSQVIGDDWILNDGGGTTINVNGVTLHDATTGVVPGAVAPNGAFNTRVNDEVRIRAEGVRVTDRSDPDPANWTITEPAEGVIADRDFSAADFIATQTGTGPTPPIFVEEYAPRAAVYEALPNVLLGLQERTSAAPRTKQPSWFRVNGHTGSQDFGRSTVGSDYDIDHIQIEAGKHFILKGETEAWTTLKYIDGTAEVSSPVQGGDINVQGLNVSLELCRGCTNHEEKYVSGEVSLGRYDLDLESDTRGNLKSGVEATSYALALEAGRRLQRTTYHLIPRIRLEHTNISIDRFTDAVDARVSYPDTDRLAIALGLRAETAPRPQKKDGLSLWGSLDLEHRLDDTQTTARVSGTRLKAESGDNSILLGLGATWQRDRLRVNAGLSAREGLDGGSESYGASLDLSLQF